MKWKWMIIALVIVVVSLMNVEMSESPESPPIQESMYEIVSPNSEKVCNGNQCVQTIYSSSRYEYDEDLKQYKNITDLLNFQIISGNINISYKDKYGVLLEPYVIKDNQKYTMSQAITYMRTKYPDSEFNFKSFKNPSNWKYALNFSGVNLSDISGLQYVGLNLIDNYGLTRDDVVKDGNNLIIKDKILLSFDDLVGSGFTVDMNKSDILVGNLTSGWLDPIVTIAIYGNETSKGYSIFGCGGSACSMYNLTYVLRGITYYALTEFNASEYTAISADDTTCIRDNIYDFNYTLPTNSIINWINASFLFSGGLTYTCSDFVWNYTSNSWIASSSGFSCGNTIAYYNINLTSGFGNYVQNNRIFFGWNTSGLLPGGMDYTYIQISYATNTAPTLENPKEPTDPSTYSSGASYQFNVTVNDADGLNDVSTVLLEFNATNPVSSTLINSTNITTIRAINTTAGEWYTSKIDLPAGTYSWKWYANDSSGENAGTQSGDFTVSRATPSIIISGSNVTYPTSVNVQASETNDGDSDMTYTFTRNGTVITSPDTTLLGAGLYNYSYNTTGGGNYTANSNQSWIQVAKGIPNIHSFELNDTYINLNGSILLAVNASQNSIVTVQLQTSGSSINYTLTYQASGNHTRVFSKANLGLDPVNSTRVNVTFIYTNNQNYTMTRNASMLYVDYGRSTISHSYFPSEPSNLPGSSITFTVKYNTTENTYITNNCSVLLRAETYYLDYSEGLHTKTVSTEGWSLHGYDYSITCSNSSYESQSASGTFTMAGTESEGGGGGGGGGGFAGFPTVEEAKEAFKEILPEAIIAPFESPLIRAELLFLGLSIIGWLYYESRMRGKKSVKKYVY